jgi:hypothetical protein
MLPFFFQRVQQKKMKKTLEGIQRDSDDNDQETGL